MTSNSGHWTYESTLTVSYSSNGTKLHGTAWSNNRAYVNIPVASPVEIEFEATQLSSTTYLEFFDSNGNSVLTPYTQANGVFKIVGDSATYTGKGGTGKYTFKIYSDRIDFYKEGTYFTTNSTILEDTFFKMSDGPNCEITIKNFKIKAFIKP